jgi:predicted  nucleic acid-binding Zn-ribbon protein
MADNAKSVNEFRSPARVLASFFRKSRDRWKQKYMDAKVELKRFKVRVADVLKSRDAWKEKTAAKQREIESLQAQMQQLQDQLSEASSRETKRMLPAEGGSFPCPMISR